MIIHGASLGIGADIDKEKSVYLFVHGQKDLEESSVKKVGRKWFFERKDNFCKKY